MLTYKRPQYLGRALESLFRYKPGSSYPIWISQDGEQQAVRAKIEQYAGRVRHIVHPHREGQPGYEAIAVHYGWALGQVFADRSVGAVIILEEDIVVAGDFFGYFAAAGAVLEADPTLWCVSSWNDNGKAANVKDPSRVYRSDFFPGLGWMMTRRLWEELGPKWPGGYWDDWMREPPQRLGRACLRPEISRSYNIGFQGGVSGNQFGSALEAIHLNTENVMFSPQKLLETLVKRPYDRALVDEVAQAVTVASLQEAHSHIGKTLVWYYSGHREFQGIAAQLGLMTDEKAGVARMAYYGAVHIRYESNLLILQDRSAYQALKEGKMFFVYPRV